MDFLCYLAMTEAEFSSAEVLPTHPAWMACHYASYDAGLSGLPDQLPESSLLIVNDRTPPSGHDPELILKQLKKLIHRHSLKNILLDLQREDFPENRALADILVSELDIPVAVSEKYAADLECPVFMDCPPPHSSPEVQFEQWSNREVWLELAPEAGIATVTSEGFTYESTRSTLPSQLPFYDEALCCHYGTQIKDDRLVVTMQRDHKALEGLCAHAKALGIRHFVGLYQLLGPKFTV